MALEMRKFKVIVLNVPTAIEVQLYGAKPFREVKEIEGYTLKDAKKRAGIK